MPNQGAVSQHGGRSVIMMTVIYFFVSVRQRVLSKETHELDLEGKGTLKLVVTQHEKTAKENVPKKETDLHQVLRQYLTWWNLEL